MARLSFEQERIWLLSRLSPDADVCNVPLTFETAGALDIPALVRALREVVRRHEVLRAAFVADDDGPRQRVAEIFAVPCGEIDLSAMSAPVARRAAVRGLRRYIQVPFDLSAPPLLRCACVRLPSGSHIVAIVVHHIAFDGWSAGILLRELGALYQDAASSVRRTLPELPVQYADYAEWQRNRTEDVRVARSLAFWRQNLTDPRPGLETLFDRPPPRTPTYRTSTVAVDIDEAVSAALKMIVRRNRTTVFVGLLAVFAALLHRWTGNSDLVIGTFISSRSHADLQGLIGFFVNTLPLRIDLRGDPPWLELVGRVRDTCFAAFDHQELPFEHIAEPLRSGPAGAPLLQVMLSLKAFPKPAGAPHLGQDVTPIHTATVSQFPLWLSFDEQDDRLIGGLKYHADMVDRTTAEGMARHFVNLLEAAVADGRARLSHLTMLDPTERRQLTADALGQSRQWADPGGSVSDLACRQAAATPDRTAVIIGAEHMSYGAVVARARAIGARLRSRGVERETRIAVCFEPSADMLVVLLGIMMAGGAYVPLDPSHPSDRLAYTIADAQPTLVLTHRAAAARLPAGTVPIVRLEDWLDGSLAEGPFAQSATGDALCYILYTSGSTGLPKGVQVEHRQLINALFALREELAFTALDVMASTTTLAFDIAALELFLPLVTGARVVVADPAADAVESFATLVDVHDATVIQATPTRWRAQLGEARGARVQVWCGGEALPGDLARALTARSDCTWNLYGPTETTIWSAAHRVPPDTIGDPPIGRPVANTQMFVLDRCGRPLPRGIRGELYIGGDGVARGYWNRPMLTADRFVPDAHSGRFGGRLYRTGDVVRRGPDGALVYLGRRDQQVKLRGHRIELGEIEAALRKCAGVTAAAVCVRPSGAGDQLFGYVVGDERLALDECRRALRAWLPPAAVPPVLVQIAALPLTGNGKVDRARLPAVAEADVPFDPPATDTERVLADIWSALLDRDRIGGADDFFALGGHSLLGTRMLARVRQVFDITVPLRTLFDWPQLAAFAAIVDGHVRSAVATRITR